MKKITILFVFAVLANLIPGSSAFGQITQVTSPQSTTTTGTTLTITRPSGLAVNDVMIANIVQSDNDNAALNDAALSGWAMIDGRDIGVSGNNHWRGTILYKTATASDVSAASFGFTLDADAEDGSVGAIVAFRGVDVTGGVTETGAAGGPFDVDPGTINTSANANINIVTATSITTATANAAVIMFSQLGNNRTHSNWQTTSPGSLTTESYDVPFDTGLDNGIGAAWTLKSTTGSTGAGTADLSDDARNGAILIALKSGPIVPPPAPNLWSANGTGSVLKYTVNPITGAITAGPSTVFTPTVSTAALAKNQISANDPNACLYYLNRDDAAALNGVVTVYAVNPDGTGNGSIGTIDMNGPADLTDFSFVRLGFDPFGRGWIIAGGNTTSIYIASFLGKGAGNALVPADINTFGNTPLTVAAPGVATEFQNGDLAITASGTLYALANVTDGQTYIYTLNSLSTPTTLTRKWTVQTGGGTFSGSVNGLAWTQSGSLHFSTGTGIYFIDQATANTISGTVQATLVPGSESTTLTDLASDKFPAQSTLPVKLGAFTVTKQGNNAVIDWTTLTEANTDHFEIERSLDGITFTTVGTKQASGSSTTAISYQHLDPITTSAKIIYYRLKTVDVDANNSLSKIVALRLNGTIVKNFTVYPNPFTSDLKVQISTDIQTDITIRISNAAGQRVVNKKVMVQTGENIVVLSSELTTLQSGMYLLEIITVEGKSTQKIIKR